MNKNTEGIVKLFNKFTYKYDSWSVFTDYVAMFAISIRNAFEKNATLENEYLKTAHKYAAEELEIFTEISAALILALEEEPGDILGEVFHQLKLHDSWKGQFFTPFHICELMAAMAFSDPSSEIENKGYIKLNEPTCGSGCMVIAFAKQLQKAGYNYQRELMAVCQDIDLKCVHMCYIQLSLLGIPAQVIHGNTLLLECRDLWNTPFMYLNQGQFSK